MKKLAAAAMGLAGLGLAALIAAPALAQTPPAAPAAAAPEYVTIKMHIDIAKPATLVWQRIGKYCDIKDWLAPVRYCEIASGDGGVGTVRKFNPEGTSVEILTAMTPLSYGYAQPLRPDRPYNLYHGFLEARPTGANTTTIHYTLMYDVSMLADQAAKDADVARRAVFEAGLAKMKEIAEKP